jgi:hypothetical protein
MKALLSLLTLAAIVLVYVLAANLYIQAQFFLAYTFVLTSIISLTFWIKNNDLLQATKKA